MDKKTLYYCLGTIGAILLLFFMDKIMTLDYQKDTYKEENKDSVVATEVTQGTKVKTSITPTKAPKLIINDSRIKSDSEKERVAAYLDAYMGLINKKDYAKAFELLKPDLIKERFYDLPTFTKYLQNTFKRQYQVRIRKINKKDDFLVAQVDLIAKQYNEEEMIKGIRYNSETFVIDEKYKGSFDIAFGGFISSKQINSDTKINDEIKVRLIKQVVYTDGIKYTLLVQNDSNKPLNLYNDINNSNIYLADLLNNKIEADKGKLYVTNKVINPKEPTLVELTFPNYYTVNSIPFKIGFDNANYDGKNFIKISILLS